MTLQEAYDLFLVSRDSYCSDVTVKNYRNTLTYFLDFMIERSRKLYESHSSALFYFFIFCFTSMFLHIF